MKHNIKRKYFLSVVWWSSNQSFRTFREAGKLRGKSDSFFCAQTREWKLCTFSSHLTISFIKSTISFIAISDNNNCLHWAKINRTEHFSGDLFLSKHENMIHHNKCFYWTSYFISWARQIWSLHIFSSQFFSHIRPLSTKSQANHKLCCTHMFSVQSSNLIYLCNNFCHDKLLTAEQYNFWIFYFW